MIAVLHLNAIYNVLKKTHFRDALFACRVMLFGLQLLSADIPPKINSFKEIFNKNHVRVSNSFDLDQVKYFSDLI